MGEAIITRRGGGRMDISDLHISDLTTSSSGDNLTIERTVDLTAIKGFFVCLENYSHSMNGAIYSSDGTLIASCGYNDFEWKDLQIEGRNIYVQEVDNTERSYIGFCFY